jgi:hypothetical protein
MRSKFEFYSNGILYKVDNDGKLNTCIDLKKVVKQIECIPALEYFHSINDKHLKKLQEKEKSNFFKDDQLNDTVVMTIPIKNNSSKKWILLFSDLEKSKYLDFNLCIKTENFI